MATRAIYISNIRILATIGVILIHATTGYLQSAAVGSFNWDYANWINGLTRCAVPLFVMISGALLLQKDESTTDFYKNRLLKIVPPFLFWTIVYIVYYFSRYTSFDQLSFQQIVTISWQKMRTGANAHLWYLYMILGLYLTVPFLRKMIRSASLREIEIFLLIWFISLYVTNKRWEEYFLKIDLTFFSGYIGYFVLGYYLSVKDFSRQKIFSLLIFSAACVFTIYITHHLSIAQQKYDPSFYGYVLPNTALAAAGIFTFLKAVSSTRNIPGWMDAVDKYSFGIYLAHILILNYVHPRLPDEIWIKVPLATIATLLGSMLLIYLIRKIPYGKYVSG
ncbi:acyltransferase [Sphingobacterium spiritivorum]